MHGNLKIIVYVLTHEEIDIFISEFNKLNAYYEYDVDINKITCDDNYNKRIKILDDFNNSTKMNILLSVHILDEAIDIPSCNSIYMTYISNSKIKNIQRMSRAMRYQNNKIAKIFLFCKDIDESMSYISSIREYDTRIDFIKKINYLYISDKIISKKEREIINNENIEKNKIKILGIKLYRSESWDLKLELVKKYIDENNKLPSTKDKNNEMKSLSYWISDQNKHYKNKKFIMSNEEIYNKWTEFINDNKYKKYFIDNETVWINKLELVKKYINENNKRPSTKDKYNEYYTLSNWLSIQSNNYKKKNDIMKNENIYNRWTEFINDEKYKIYFEDNDKKWLDTLEQVKQYIDENNKRPSARDKNNEDYTISSWLRTQIANYGNKKQILSNEDIYNKWTQFINNKKYKKYFFDNETKWNNNLELIKKYIDENNKLPSRSESRWIEIQKINYKNKTQIMSNKNIYNKWTEFINDNKYKKYF
jgi:hypothetical protein